MTSITKTCSNCKTNIGSQRTYPWYCTPKRKYNKDPFWTQFTIYLCDSCYHMTTDCKSVCGWDWWDAYDDLHSSFFLPQAHKDTLDRSTAILFGFNNVQDLRLARQDKRNAWENTKEVSKDPV